MVIQHSSETLVPLNVAHRDKSLCLRADQPVTEALVIAFNMVMTDELGRSLSNRVLAEQNQPFEARLLNRPHESFRVGVQIGAPRRNLDRRNARIREHLQELRRE